MLVSLYKKYKVEITTRYSHLDENKKFVRDVTEEKLELIGHEVLAKLSTFCSDPNLEEVEITSQRFSFRIFNRATCEEKDIWVELRKVDNWAILD